MAHNRSALITLGLVAACTTGPRGELAELEAARDRWVGQAIEAYTAVLERSCFCAPPHRVEVQVSNGNVTRIDLDTGLPVPPQLASAWPEVTGLFALIEQEIRRPAAQLSVTYDPVAGYPTAIVVDPIANAIDDEYSYRVTSLQVP